MHPVHDDETSGVTHRCQEVGDETSFPFVHLLHAQLVCPFVEADEEQGSHDGKNEGNAHDEGYILDGHDVQVCETEQQDISI